MSAAVWGLALGAGLVLVASPWIWPAAARTVRARREGPLRRLDTRLRQAGFDRIAPSAVIAVVAAAALVAGLLVLAFVPVTALAVAAALAAGSLPVAAITARARARRRAMRSVWPDALDHLVAGLRAGRPLPDAVCALGEAGPEPLRPAFRALAADYGATGSIGLALDELKSRLADPVADRVVETLRVAREVGGTELPAVLRALAAHLRADQALRAEVEARQSWVVSAARLGVAAPWLVLVLLAARPEAVRAYNSPGGLAVLAVGLVLTVVAYRLMLAVGRLPEERRWFA